MQNQRMLNLHRLGISARVMLVLMLILPAIAPVGIAEANQSTTPVISSALTANPPSIQTSDPQALPFTQDWSNTSLISVDNDWSGVRGIMGYRGDNLTGATGTDPQTLLMDGTSTPVNVIANQVDPNGFYTGGVTEFELADPVVALAGSGTADAPFILISIDTQGMENIVISYNLRDLESGADNAQQQVALHYRIGSSGDFTNLPDGYVSDATVGGATMVTPVSVNLPINANDQPVVQLRVMTTNAVGNDEWVGVDDISITGTPISPVPRMQIAKAGPGVVNVNDSYNYTLSVINSLGITATQVVVTDSLPLSLTFQSASDGGALIEGTNVVSWTIPSLADGISVNRTVTVAAPGSETTIVNYDYGVWASNWLTFTLGEPVTTTVRDPDIVTPIAEARAEGPGWYGTVQGNVTVVPGTFYARSFAIQDETGGLYMYPSSSVVRPPMVLGDVIRVKGTIKNFNGLLEMDPVESITWIDAGPVPDPEFTPISALAPTQGKLVQIEGIATEITGTGNKSITIHDETGQTTVYVYSLTGIDLSSFSYPMEMRVTGFSGAYTTGPQVQPRYQFDIIDLRPPTVTLTIPGDNATDVSLYYPLQATFSKSMAASTLNPETFTLVNALGPVGGTVSYDDSNKTANFSHEALIPFTAYTATLTTGIQDAYGISLTEPYSWTFTTGAADETPPSIVAVSPSPDAIEVPLSANVVITFTEDIHPDSLDPEHFILEGPFGTVPSALSYDQPSYVVRLDPEARLLPTAHYTATVMGTVIDWAGHPLGEDFSWTFETSVEPPMQVYFGDLHNHTSYSDGSGTPAEALAAGEAAGFDFMAISDHSYAIDDAEWEDTLAAVEAATNANFLAIRGFEYTQGAEGHINVYNTVRHAVRTDTGCSYCDYTPNLEQGATVEGFYHWASTTGMIGIDEAGTVMQFNHPSWINFNDWTYHPEVSDIAKLEEVGNGNGSSYAFSEDELIRSLDYGWKVAATNNADTHTAYWGVNTDHRTGVLMSELTKEALLEALHERRTFATEDKNFSLTMKANGAWMGSEIANSGQIQLEIVGDDPDGEQTSMVQIITDQGKVAIQEEPGSASFTWSPVLDIATGIHYYYVRVTQADGERIISSPVWTMGEQDISITDVVIQPSNPTTQSPSLLTARITNRDEVAQNVTVRMDINGEYLPTDVPVTVLGNDDAYANFSWQPTITGEVTITAHIIGAPLGDNPDDNESSLYLNVSDEALPLILIDAGHGNLNASGREMRMFIDDLSAHKYNVLKNLDELTSEDLNPDIVKLLLITAPQTAYTGDELTAIANYIAAGGNLWLCGLSDYTGSVPWAATVANRENDILAAIETAAATNINMRMNDDEIIDGDDNNGYVFGPIWGNFPSEGDTSIGINVEAMASWSVASLRGRNPDEPLTATTPDVQIVVLGDLDEGYMDNPPYYDPYHTTNTDADGSGDAYFYNPGWVYPNPAPPDAIPVPMAAVTDLPGQAGRIMLYGDSNDAFTTYAYTAGDGKQNELFNLEAAMWLLSEPLQKSSVAEARAQSAPNQPDNLDKLVWVEGEITAAYGEFFNVLYLQDETGGITVHAPAGDIDPGSYTRGTQVRAVGTVGIYNGDTEIEFFEAEMVQVITPTVGEPVPLPMSTYQASLEESQGWLAVMTGTVTSKVGEDNLFIDDDSGPVRIFLDGYNGDFSDIQVNDLVRVTGLVSEDGDGQRIRVRNHGMHPEYADDVIDLPHVVIQKTANGPEIANLGDEITYTLGLSNTGGSAAQNIVMTDTLPSGITFGGWVEQNGAAETGGVITWEGDLTGGREFVFTATLDYDSSLYGQTITNTVEFISANAGSGSATAAFRVGSPELSISKIVETKHDPAEPSDPITYTVVVRNDGTAQALGVHVWDNLPEVVIGSDVNITITIDANTTYTINIPAMLSPDAPIGSTIINTAYYAMGELSGEASATVSLAPHSKFYLPLITKD